MSKIIHIFVQGYYADKLNWPLLKSRAGICEFILLTDIKSKVAINRLGRAWVFSNIILLNKAGFDGQIDQIIDGLKKKDKNIEIKINVNDEFMLIPCARVRERWEIKGDSPKVMELFRSKIHMKQSLTSNNQLVPNIPRFHILNISEFLVSPENYLQNIREDLLEEKNESLFPLFIKPTAGAGAAKAEKLSSAQELDIFIREVVTSTSSEFQIEKYINGTLYHCDSVVENGKLITAIPSQYIHPCHEFMQGKVISSYTLSGEDPLFDRIQHFNKQVLQSFKAYINDQLGQSLPSGCYHHEFYLDKLTNRFVFVEVAARSPGGLIPEMYLQSHGIDMRIIHMEIQMGIFFQRNHIVNQRGYAGFFFMPTQHAIIEEINNPALDGGFALESEVPFMKWKKFKGDAMLNPVDVSGYLCALVLFNRSFENLILDLEKLERYPFFTPKSTIRLKNEPTVAYHSNINETAYMSGNGFLALADGTVTSVIQYKSNLTQIKVQRCAEISNIHCDLYQLYNLVPVVMPGSIVKEGHPLAKSVLSSEEWISELQENITREQELENLLRLTLVETEDLKIGDLLIVKFLKPENLVEKRTQSARFFYRNYFKSPYSTPYTMHMFIVGDSKELLHMNPPNCEASLIYPTELRRQIKDYRSHCLVYRFANKEIAQEIASAAYLRIETSSRERQQFMSGFGEHTNTIYKLPPNFPVMKWMNEVDSYEQHKREGKPYKKPKASWCSRWCYEILIEVFKKYEHLFEEDFISQITEEKSCSTAPSGIESLLNNLALTNHVFLLGKAYVSVIYIDKNRIKYGLSKQEVIENYFSNDVEVVTPTFRSKL